MPMSEVFAYVLEQRYNGFFLFSGKLTPLSDFVPEIHQDVGDLHSPGYINNFIFLPEETPAARAFARLACFHAERTLLFRNGRATEIR